MLNINQRLPHPVEPSNEYTMLAGAIINRLNHIPEAGEKLKLGQYDITILSKDGNFIILAQLHDLKKEI